MIVKMLKTLTGSPDGVSVSVYKMGDVVDLPESLVNSFIEQGGIELHDSPKMEKPEENKAIEGAPENKSEKPKRGKKRDV